MDWIFTCVLTQLLCVIQSISENLAILCTNYLTCFSKSILQTGPLRLLIHHLMLYRIVIFYSPYFMHAYKQKETFKLTP